MADAPQNENPFLDPLIRLRDLEHVRNEMSAALALDRVTWSLDRDHLENWRDQLDTIILSLRAASEWQPIATARKDGRSVLLTWQSIVTIGYWALGPHWKTAIGTGFPTHWKPLPASPRVPTEGK